MKKLLLILSILCMAAIESWSGSNSPQIPINSRAYYEQEVDPGTTDSSVSSKDYDWNFRMITYSY